MWACLWLIWAGTVEAALPDFDFADAAAAREWGGAHDCDLGTAVPGSGMPIRITGPDPYLTGPARDFPAGRALWLNLRLKSESGGVGQVFHFDSSPSESQSVRFAVQAGDWTVVRVPLPQLGPGYRLRIDPPGDRGTCLLARLTFDDRPLLSQPAWPHPQVTPLVGDLPAVQSGALELRHGKTFGDFRLRVAGKDFAAGNMRSAIGYRVGNDDRWFEVTNAAVISREGQGMTVTTAVRDPDGASWKIRQGFSPATRPGGIAVETRVTVDRERRVTFLPLLTLLPGAGAAFGTNKSQGLLAGVEYLENEDSSSERDLRGPQARRQVPDAMKLTFPLMALAADGRWAGLMWEPARHLAALHDTPDRIFGGGGSVMALLFPGAGPAVREDGNVLPYEGGRLAAEEPLVLRATIIGGRGGTVVPAVQEYVTRRGLPPLPDPGRSAESYFRLAARGWLDSSIREGDRFRHAVGATFPAQPAADAALYMGWLADHVGDASLAGRLAAQSAGSREIVPPGQWNSAAIGHVRQPVPALVFGGALESAATAQREGEDIIARFQADGTLPFVAPAGSELGLTHWSAEANGLAGTMVSMALDRALFSGDPALIRKSLELLRGLARFDGTVPRGAQTWEVPLHTPDILASAYLCRAHVVGYELTGDPEFLERAIHWAWTGVPFIYLQAPDDRPVGVYSTTPVLGATQFVAPNWIGLPVQWCGLVYADAVRRLARHDANGPWLRLADGIAFSGVQQTHTEAEPDKVGLLPDSFDLRAQFRNPVPINPGTLQPLALQAYGEPALHDYHVFRRHGLRVHAPGPISDARETADGISFQVTGWPRQPWWILINGCTKVPAVRVNGQETPVSAPHRFDPKTGRLTLQLRGPTTVEVRPDGAP